MVELHRHKDVEYNLFEAFYKFLFRTQRKKLETKLKKLCIDNGLPVTEKAMEKVYLCVYLLDHAGIKRFMNKQAEDAESFQLQENQLRHFCDQFHLIYSTLPADDRMYYKEMNDSFVNWQKKVFKRLGWSVDNPQMVEETNTPTQKSFFTDAKFNRQTADEKGMLDFLDKPIHFYHLTAHGQEQEYWNYTVLDFTAGNMNSKQELITQSDVANYDRSETLPYLISIYRETPLDSIFLKIWSYSGRDRVNHAILDHFMTHTKCVGGVMYHLDWVNVLRLSPVLMSFKPRIDQKDNGPVSIEDGAILFEEWYKFYALDGTRPILKQYVEKQFSKNR